MYCVYTVHTYVHTFMYFSAYHQYIGPLSMNLIELSTEHAVSAVLGALSVWGKGLSQLNLTDADWSALLSVMDSD